MDSRDKFEETKLPPRPNFYSHLKEEGVSEDDYAHALKVWNELNIQNMRQYHDLYLTLDVLLLAEVFENFRRMSLNYYELYPYHYYTLPGLSFDACLKMTKIELSRFAIPNSLFSSKIVFVEACRLWAIDMQLQKNESVPDYNPDYPTSWILFVDANNFVWLFNESTL